MSVKSGLVEKLKTYTAENRAESVIVASQGGKSAIKLAEELEKGSNIVAISEFAFSDAAKKTMKKQKITAVENADLPIQDIREMRETLMMFDSGIKAALEVASIAASKGLVNGSCIAVASSGHGLDTALIVSTVNPDAESISEPLKKLKIEKILASPLIE